jgi:maltose O-acetyltransferase
MYKNFFYISIGRLFFLLRKIYNRISTYYYFSKINKIGKYSHIDSTFIYSGNLFIGNNVHISRNCIFQNTKGNIIIGNNTMFGPGVQIHGGNHNYIFRNNKIEFIPKNKIHKDPDILIGDNVWIGSNVIILKGTVIGSNSIIGAGTIVSYDVPEFSLVYGAKPLVIKKNNNEEFKH